MVRLGETFVRRRLMDAELKYLPPDITDPKELKKQHDMFTILRWNHTPMRREDTSLDTILQRINDMESTMLRTIRGGGKAIRQRGVQPIRRPAVASQPQPPPQPRQPIPMRDVPMYERTSSYETIAAVGFLIIPPRQGQQPNPTRRTLMKRQKKSSGEGTSTSHEQPQPPPQAGMPTCPGADMN